MTQIKCKHRGYEVMYRKVRRGSKIVRRLWMCAYCRKKLKGPGCRTKNEKIVNEFRGGLSRVGLARKHRVTVERVDKAIREALR